MTTLLNENSEQLDVESNIKLFPHQKAVLNAMIKREMAVRNETLVGILADTVGSGKSYEVLSLILLEKKTFEKTQNLLVVPPSLHAQWCEYIKIFSPELRVQSLMYYSDITDLFHDARILSSFDILITTPSFYRLIAETMKDIKAYFCRVIIDEVDSISFYTEIKMPALTIWLVSATSELTASGAFTQFIKPENCIKCDPSFIEKSIRIPTPKVQVHQCYNEYIDILQSLSFCGSGTEEFGLTKNKKNLFALDFPEFRFKFFTKQICNARDLLSNTFIDHMEELKTLYSSIEFSASRAQDPMIREKLFKGVSQVSGQLKDGEILTFDRIKGLGEKSKRFEIVKNEMLKIISLTSKKFCPICACGLSESPSVKTVCCNAIYHSKCLGTNNVSLKGVPTVGCPICVSKKTVETVPFLETVTLPAVSVDKYEEFMKIVESERHNENFKLLVFSDFYGTFSSIRTLLEKAGIEYSELSGNQIEIGKALEGFKFGSKKILLIHSSQYGSGLNLEFSSSIILWHKSDRNEQLIGRAQRFGRKTQLNIHHLLYTGE